MSLYSDKSPLYKALKRIFQARSRRNIATYTADADGRLEIDGEFIPIVRNPDCKFGTIRKRESVRRTNLTPKLERSELSDLRHALHLAPDESELEIAHRILQDHLQTT